MESTMVHAYSAQFVHVVFSVKDRKDLIPADLHEKLAAYIGGIVRKLGADCLAIGGTANHLHILMTMRPTLRLADTVQKLKANSSRWLGEQGVMFEWQKGYGAFSVSPSLLPVVQAYIRNQAEHHQKRSYDEEFLSLLRKSGLRFDPQEALG
jgi:REP element-mobilizing transposase RayT